MTITRLPLAPELTVESLKRELCRLHINGITTLPVSSTHPCMHEDSFAWSYILSFATVLTACYGYKYTLSSLMQNKQLSAIHSAKQNHTPYSLNGCRKHHDSMTMLSIRMRQVIPCDCWFNTLWRLISLTKQYLRKSEVLPLSYLCLYKSIYAACVKSDNFIFFYGIYHFNHTKQNYDHSIDKRFGFISILNTDCFNAAEEISCSCVLYGIHRFMLYVLDETWARSPGFAVRYITLQRMPWCLACPWHMLGPHLSHIVN